ncbi:PREDICTED: ABSCISIC ACID-INSENSITIVE 5-like protein 5 [Ipomoea nil]|uniref:ABSCISIC ACID-INSENSITIVE 5-like protein 5 n=1 Tax=Ipomoea nil TaxID=35883 RepID=UPI000901A984|nr:PREDICTED: ABSCISIC ACID-INSENSITIVE 5-like protein 5 [Ipomoea nil]
MGSNLNFGNEPPGSGGGGRFPGNFGLTRQSSVYSLTFDEFQSSMGGIGKDFGSMNMDELLKNIWSAEENQTTMGSSSGAQEGGVPGPGGYLQRQGSLTLPRTLSQKTVDEVWRDMSKVYDIGKDGSAPLGSSNIPQRQPTLGEITLEEFLVRAGVVREEAQLAGKAAAESAALFGDLTHTLNNSGLGFGFQQAGQNTGLMGSRTNESRSVLEIQPASMPLNVNRARSAQPQLGTAHLQQQPQQKQHQQPLFPKQPVLPYAVPMAIPTTSPLGSNGIRGGTVGASDPAMNGSNAVMNGGFVQSPALHGGRMGMVGLGAGGVSVATGSPAVSSDGFAKSNGDTSSVSPVPFVFNGSLRGRKCSAIEKVVERRQRRMIKNRESAARSRARKQAYTMELEAEVAKLKEENEELQKKQTEIMEMQKNMALEMMNNIQQGAKRRCLRRTQTGLW